MAVAFEHSIDLACPPSTPFAILDDVSKTPSWLARCTGIEMLTPGPLAVGTKLKYSYKDGGRSGQMDGELVERIADEALSFRYWDAMFDVSVKFRMSKTPSGTRLTHTIEMTPKTFLCRLMQPLIRGQLPKQTIAAMEKLRGLVETKG
jgi:hypothetical protein